MYLSACLLWFAYALQVGPGMAVAAQNCGFARDSLYPPPNREAFETVSKEGTSSTLHDLRIAKPGELVRVPIEKVRWWLTSSGASSQQNHFVRFYTQGEASLWRYYESHQTTNIWEAAFTNSPPLYSADYKRFRVPWEHAQLFEGTPDMDWGDARGKLEDQAVGPVTQGKYRTEVKRLQRIKEAISKSGLIRLPYPDFIHF